MCEKISGKLFPDGKLDGWMIVFYTFIKYIFPRSSYIWKLEISLALKRVFLSVKMLLKIPFLGGNPLGLQNMQYNDWKYFTNPAFNKDISTETKNLSFYVLIKHE